LKRVIEACRVRASQRSLEFEQEGAFRSWLVRVLIDEALAVLRKNRAANLNTVYLSIKNDSRRFGPKRNTAKSASRDATRSIPKRRITARLVRSTMEKSWSRQETPISQATSRSANVTVSITAIPVRRPSQNRSAALRSRVWCSKVDRRGFSV